MEGLDWGYSQALLERDMIEALVGKKRKKFITSTHYSYSPIPITFTNDLRGLHLPHDDALVISVIIANFNVHRILVDNGSSAYILFIAIFDKIKIGLDKLHPFHTPLVGFGENTTHPLGWIKLPVTLGTEPHQTTVWQDFIVVDVIRPIKHFPNLMGIGEVKGDQKVGRQCFISIMKDESHFKSSSQ